MYGRIALRAGVGSTATSPVSQSIRVFGGEVRWGELVSSIMVYSMLVSVGIGFGGVVSLVTADTFPSWNWGSKNLMSALSSLRMRIYPYMACQAPGVESKGIGERFSESIQYQVL